MGEPLAKAFQDLVAAIGPAGAVGVAIAALALFFYRRDFLRERKNHREKQETANKREDRLLTVVERSAVATEALSQEIKRLGDWMREAEASRERQLDRLFQEFRR